MSSNSSYVPSPQQQAVYDWVKSGKGSAIIEAVAGAGKTDTLARAIGMMNGYVTAMAYNKSAAAELKDRIQRYSGLKKEIMVSTCHGVGFRAWMRAYPKCQVNEKKTAHILARMAEEGNALVSIIGPFVERMVSFGTQMLAGVDWDVTNKFEWMELVSHYGVDNDFPEDVDMNEALDVVIQVFERSAALCSKEISFDDMLYAPIRYNLKMFKVNWVLMDEAQDSNMARRRLAKMILAPGGRFVGVGDSRQAIYGFAGASSDSLECLKKDFKCSTLPLTVTYRCPKSVVNYVKSWVSHIEAHPNAPEGEVIMTAGPKTSDEPMWYMSVADTDAILCRYTKPLVSMAYTLIKNSVACRVEGRDIGKGLIQLASRWKVSSLDKLESKLETWLDREIAKARAADSETREQSARDKFDTLHIFIQRCRNKGNHTVNCLKQEIEVLFADDVKGCAVLATIHRSKGREWPKVWWMQSTIKGQSRMKDWEKVQEDNLCYVAGTRAQATLALVPENLQS